MSTPIPDQPVTYTDEDFATSTERIRAARERRLRNPKAAAALQALGEEIAKRLNQKRATLSEVRRAVGLTQKQLAETLRMEQGDLSKLERRQNLHLTTLTRFIEATGGRLRITPSTAMPNSNSTSTTSCPAETPMCGPDRGSTRASWDAVTRPARDCPIDVVPANAQPG